jgi:diadenosine tetraphosphate (Ap4A) HIT family hydrolase
MSEFALDHRLAADSLPVAELELCSLRLMNDRRFPWLLLIPRRVRCVEILDLGRADQTRLWNEILLVSGLLKNLVKPDKLNVAALGNQVAQLHVHLIARYRDDAAWPMPVWGSGPGEPRGGEAEKLIRQFRQSLADLGARPDRTRSA